MSQFATTLFNAAFFAGLDIREYQAHSEYFSRYPRGREATMGFPNPDLVIENTTPYGDPDLDVLHRHEPHDHAVLDAVRHRRADRHHRGQLGQLHAWSPPPAPAPTSTAAPETDEFRATYRPGEGQFC